MQRLAAFLPVRRAMCAASLLTCQRFEVQGVPGTEPGYTNRKAKEKLQNQDEHWLEAEMDRTINTPEERYAHEQEMRLIRKMMEEITENHDLKLAKAKEERDREITRLRAEIEGLENRMNSLKKK